MRLAHDVEEGDLADRGGDTGIVRRGGEGVASSHRGAEGRHPARVDPWQRASEGDGGAPILELARRIEEIGLAAAVAEPAVIENECGESRGRKALGKGPKPVSPRPGEAVGHDHDRGLDGKARRRIEPRGARVLVRAKFDISTVHFYSTTTSVRA